MKNFQGLVQLVPFYQVSVEISFAKTWSHIHPDVSQTMNDYFIFAFQNLMFDQLVTMLTID